MPPEVALNLPWWFVVLVVGCCVYLLALTRSPKDAYVDMVEPDPGVAHEAMGEEAGDAIQPAPLRAEAARVVITVK